MSKVAVLHPRSLFAGLVRDSAARWWTVFACPPPAPYVRSVPVLARSGPRHWRGVFWPKSHIVEPVTAGAFAPAWGRDSHFFDAIAELLVDVGRQLERGEMPAHGAHALLAKAVA